MTDSISASLTMTSSAGITTTSNTAPIVNTTSSLLDSRESNQENKENKPDTKDLYPIKIEVKEESHSSSETPTGKDTKSMYVISIGFFLIAFDENFMTS